MTRGIIRLAAALTGLLAFAGCDDAAPEAPAPEAPAIETAAPEAPAQPALREVMMGHFERADRGRAALIRGDIEEARESMQWLATHDLGGTIPEALRPHFAAMQASAASFGEASTLRDAGVAFARTLTHCGSCHQEAGAGPTFAMPPLPEGDDMPAHMRRHRWGADRMWEGLVTSSDDIFREGGNALTGTPLDAHVFPEGAVDLEQAQALATHVHELGAQAAAATDADGRVTAYGHFLATCASCHRALGVGDVVQAAEGQE